MFSRQRERDSRERERDRDRDREHLVERERESKKEPERAGGRQGPRQASGGGVEVCRILERGHGEIMAMHDKMYKSNPRLSYTKRVGREWI